jgi:hypothetical protein
MRTNYVLVDYENLQISSVDMLLAEHFRLLMFLGPNNTKLPTDLVVGIQKLHARAEYFQLVTPGHNALDFQLTFYLGTLTAKDASGYFHIISRDKGFDPLIRHLRTQGISITRSETIEDMPCFKPLEITPAAKPTVVPVQSTGSGADLIKLVVSDLISRKASKPRTVKTLMSTIHAKVGKNRPVSEINSIYKALRDKGYVQENGTKVSYKLPQRA